MVTMNGGSLLRSSRGGAVTKVMAAALLALFLVALMTSSAKAGTPVFSLGFKNSEGGATQLNNPVGVGTDSAGNVYVANKGAGRIEKFSPSGKYLAKFGSPGSGTGQLLWPSAVDVDPSGNVWVADNGNSRVVEYSSTGAFVRQLAMSWRPTGIATDAAGNVWIMVAELGTAWKIDPNAKYIGSTGGYVNGHGIDVGPEGHVWVTDDTKVYDLAPGAPVKSWSPGGVPAGISVDASGNVWVGVGCQVRKYSPSGTLLDKFGECGTGAGKIGYMSKGDGIAVAPEGAIWVSNSGINEVQKWVPTP